MFLNNKKKLTKNTTKILSPINTTCIETPLVTIDISWI
jgi:hypothetical protein